MSVENVNKIYLLVSFIVFWQVAGCFRYEGICLSLYEC